MCVLNSCYINFRNIKEYVVDRLCDPLNMISSTRQFMEVDYSDDQNEKWYFIQLHLHYTICFAAKAQLMILVYSCSISGNRI